MDGLSAWIRRKAGEALHHAVFLAVAAFSQLLQPPVQGLLPADGVVQSVGKARKLLLLSGPDDSSQIPRLFVRPRVAGDGEVQRFPVPLPVLVDIEI